MFDYCGDDICFEEMPQGCVISSKDGEVVVSSPRDVIALRNSLNRFIEVMIKRGEIVDNQPAPSWDCPNCHQSNFSVNEYCWLCFTYNPNKSKDFESKNE